jgi:hypothetical protein
VCFPLTISTRAAGPTRARAKIRLYACAEICQVAAVLTVRTGRRAADGLGGTDPVPPRLAQASQARWNVYISFRRWPTSRTLDRARERVCRDASG